MRLISAVLAAGLLWSTQAAAALKPAYGPPASWVEVAPLPDPPPVDDAPAVQTLLDDNQSRLGPDGDAYYNRRVWKILKPEGLRRFTSLGHAWDPANETVTFHGMKIIRDGKAIDLLKGGRGMLVIRREQDLERAMLDGRLTASQQIEGLQVGDIIDYSWTQTRNDPIVAGRSYDHEAISFTGVGARYRVILSWPVGAPVSWKASPGFGDPQVTTRDGRTWLRLDVRNVSTPKPPLGAPPRFQRLGTLETTEFQNWREVSALMQPHYAKAAILKPGSPLKAEAAAIAARTSDPKARALAALQLVQEKTRYFFVGMDNGGYVPADADLTWTRKFADCKGKTTLLLALLNELGVEAEPALVNMGSGDGLNERAPSLGAFNHVLVRAVIADKVYWLDGTRTGDRSLDVLRPPPHRWALPLRSAGADMEPIVVPPFAEPTMDALYRLDASNGLDAPAAARMQMRVLGDAAKAMRQMVATLPRPDLERSLRQAVSSNAQWIEVDKIDWKDDPDNDAFQLEVSGKVDMDWRRNQDVGAREYRVVAAPTQLSRFPRREPGLNSDAPFVVPYPFYVRSVTEVVLPDRGKGFMVRGPNAQDTVGGVQLNRVSTLADGVARFVVEGQTVVPEISVAEAEAASKAMRRITGEDSLVRAPL